MATIYTLQKTFLPAIAPEDFFLLLSHATHKPKIFLFAHPEYELTREEEKNVQQYLRRRLDHEPVAYITGHKEFYGRDFLVNQDTLIPRPETELLVEKVLETIASRGRAEKVTDIIDLGTGSGNIIITLAKEIQAGTSSLPAHYTLSAIDTSSPALEVAKHNARIHDIGTNITFLKNDLLKNYSPPQEKNHHCIIAANLPYLSTVIYNASERDVHGYEPKGALMSGKHGLDHYLRLFKELPVFSRHYLSTTIFLEISPEQSTLLRHLILTALPQATFFVFQDLSGRDRLIRISL